MGKSKIVYNGSTLIDLTSDTVTSEKMLTTATAHDASGESITGNIATKTSTDVTSSGATVTVPSGYYASQVQKSVSNGSAGTPTATKGSVSNNQVTVTPSVTNTTGYITGGTKTGTAVTVKASELVSGSETKTANGTYDVTNLASLIVNVSGGGLPTGFSALAMGEYTVSSDFTTTRQTVTHNLGVTPDMVIFYYDGAANGNIATTYTMLASIRCTKFGWRSSSYNLFNIYHGNSTSTVTTSNINSTSVGVSNLTTTTFQIASHSTSYYWRGGKTYKWIAIKFS